MTKEEIIAIVHQCTARLGHVPNTAEFLAMGKVSKRQVRKHFGSHTRMLAASGVEGEGPGYPISMRCLFLDWARVVRGLGKVPTVMDYELQGKYSTRPLSDRFGCWRDVPAGMLEWARQGGLEDEWQDVLDIIVLHEQRARRSPRISGTISATTSSSAFKPGSAAYGRPLTHAALRHAPTNEAGVVLLFGSMARELGFRILRVQTEFPDCEAMREMEPNRWQRVRIEFEYESRSFLEHMHPAGECDLIVCWSHNWPDCPLEVLELQSLLDTCHNPGGSPVENDGCSGRPDTSSEGGPIAGGETFPRDRICYHCRP